MSSSGQITATDTLTFEREATAEGSAILTDSPTQGDVYTGATGEAHFTVNLSAMGKPDLKLPYPAIFIV